CFTVRPPSPPATYTLSLHDALPIYPRSRASFVAALGGGLRSSPISKDLDAPRGWTCSTLSVSDAGLPGFSRRSVPRSSAASSIRSEEHTSELQSRFDLVCRLLPEKK